MFDLLEVQDDRRSSLEIGVDVIAWHQEQAEEPPAGIFDQGQNVLPCALTSSNHVLLIIRRPRVQERMIRTSGLSVLDYPK